MCQWELSLSHVCLGEFESASARYHILKEVCIVVSFNRADRS
jgi:hypothetical protein